MSRTEFVPESIRAWRIALPLRAAFSNASSWISRREVIVIRLDGDGQSGWGEAAPYPEHAGPPIDELWSQLIRVLEVGGLGALPPAGGLLRAAFNQALDDIASRKSGQPLWSMLGGGNPVPASAAIGVDQDGQPDSNQLAAAAAAGYKHAKLKITPKTDPARVAAAMAAHPGLSLGLDANGSLDEGAINLIRALDDLGPAYIEQPGDPDDLGWHRELRDRMKTRIALDEAATTAASIKSIVELGAADIVTLKVGRFGSSATVALAEQAVAGGISARVGGLMETGIGRAHTIAVASHPAFDVVGDVAASDHFFSDDLVRPQWRLTNGRLQPPTGVGIAVAVDMAAITGNAVDSLTID